MKKEFYQKLFTESSKVLSVTMRHYYHCFQNLKHILAYKGLVRESITETLYNGKLYPTNIIVRCNKQLHQ